MNREADAVGITPVVPTANAALPFSAGIGSLRVLIAIGDPESPSLCEPSALIIVRCRMFRREVSPVEPTLRLIRSIGGLKNVAEVPALGLEGDHLGASIPHVRSLTIDAERYLIRADSSSFGC